MEEKHKSFPFDIPETTPEQEIAPDQQNGARIQIEARPTLITVLCGYCFVSWCLNIIWWIAILSQTSVKSFNLTGISSLGGFVSFVFSCSLVVAIFGYWFMRKWGVYLYTISIASSLVYTLFKINSFSLTIFLGFLLPLAIIIAGFMHLERMQ